MIGIPAGARILVATRPVDFRKGAYGLAALASQVLGEDPYAGVVIVFRAKRGDRVTILLWDASGFVLIWKQLQQGGFRWPPIMDGVMKLSAVEFAALFDGLDWTRVQATKRIPKPSAVVQDSLRDAERKHRDARPARHRRRASIVALGDIGRAG
jgi:transposase